MDHIVQSVAQNQLNKHNFIDLLHNLDTIQFKTQPFVMFMRIPKQNDTITILADAWSIIFDDEIINTTNNLLNMLINKIIITKNYKNIKIFIMYVLYYAIEIIQIYFILSQCYKNNNYLNLDKIMINIINWIIRVYNLYFNMNGEACLLLCKIFVADPYNKNLTKISSQLRIYLYQINMCHQCELNNKFEELESMNRKQTIFELRLLWRFSLLWLDLNKININIEENICNLENIYDNFSRICQLYLKHANLIDIKINNKNNKTILGLVILQITYELSKFSKDSCYMQPKIVKRLKKIYRLLLYKLNEVNYINVYACVGLSELYHMCEINKTRKVLKYINKAFKIISKSSLEKYKSQYQEFQLYKRLKNLIYVHSPSNTKLINKLKLLIIINTDYNHLINLYQVNQITSPRFIEKMEIYLDKDDIYCIINNVLKDKQCNYKKCHRKDLFKYKICKKCKKALYCNRRHQKKDWKENHRKNCK